MLLVEGNTVIFLRHCQSVENVSSSSLPLDFLMTTSHRLVYLACKEGFAFSIYWDIQAGVLLWLTGRPRVKLRAVTPVRLVEFRLIFSKQNQKSI